VVDLGEWLVSRNRKNIVIAMYEAIPNYVGLKHVEDCFVPYNDIIVNY
jgi:hypothetical protein